MGCGSSKVMRERSSSTVTIEPQQRAVAAYRRQRIAREMEQTTYLRAEMEVEKALMNKRYSIEERRPSYIQRVLEDLAEVHEEGEEETEDNSNPNKGLGILYNSLEENDGEELVKQDQNGIGGHLELYVPHRQDYTSLERDKNSSTNQTIQELETPTNIEKGGREPHTTLHEHAANFNELVQDVSVAKVMDEGPEKQTTGVEINDAIEKLNVEHSQLGKELQSNDKNRSRSDDSEYRNENERNEQESQNIPQEPQSSNTEIIKSDRLTDVGEIESVTDEDTQRDISESKNKDSAILEIMTGNDCADGNLKYVNEEISVVDSENSKVRTTKE